MLFTLISLILLIFVVFKGGSELVSIGYLVAAGLFAIAGAISISGKDRG